MNNSLPDLPDLGALSPWAEQLARTFVSLASDIALVIEPDGTISTVSQGGGAPIAPDAASWVGRAWADTVSGDTRAKIERLLQEANDAGLARRREVNHLLGDGHTVPVAYTAVRLGEGGPVLAVGRDLRMVAAIQQRYVESQQDLERGYWQARLAETRYQLLFQVATDAVLVVDAQALQILECNQAAARLFQQGAEQLQGRHVGIAFDHPSRAAVAELLANARSSGHSGEIRARLQGTRDAVSVAATPFVADGRMRLLVRVRAVDIAEHSHDLNQTLARLVDEASDAVVVTDSSGRVLVANPAFLLLLGVEREGQVLRRPLMDWLSPTSAPVGTLVRRVRQEGVVRRLGARLQNAAGTTLVVNISATLLTEGDQECIGFTIRPDEDTLPPVPPLTLHGQAPLAEPDTPLARALREDIAALTAQLGERGLSDLRRHAALLAERHLVAAALEQAQGDAAQAAQLLGVSPASLARRLRRLPQAGPGRDDPPQER